MITSFAAPHAKGKIAKDKIFGAAAAAKVDIAKYGKEVVVNGTQGCILDEEGKLSCLKAFKVARLIGKEPKEMSAITKSLGIKITNCELGVFGKLKFQDPNIQVYNKLKQNYSYKSNENNTNH